MRNLFMIISVFIIASGCSKEAQRDNRLSEGRDQELYRSQQERLKQQMAEAGIPMPSSEDRALAEKNAKISEIESQQQQPHHYFKNVLTIKYM